MKLKRVPATTKMWVPPPTGLPSPIFVCVPFQFHISNKKSLLFYATKGVGYSLRPAYPFGAIRSGSAMQVHDRQGFPFSFLLRLNLMALNLPHRILSRLIHQSVKFFLPESQILNLLLIPSQNCQSEHFPVFLQVFRNPVFR